MTNIKELIKEKKKREVYRNTTIRVKVRYLEQLKKEGISISGFMNKSLEETFEDTK